MHKIRWNIAAFLLMYLIATVLGFATYIFVNSLTMIICVFTIMPVVSTFLIYWYLCKISVDEKRLRRDVFILIFVWITLSFGFDAVTYILIVPTILNMPPHWSFFVEQSPWIWISYLALIVSSLAAKWLYSKRFIHAGGTI